MAKSEDITDSNIEEAKVLDGVKRFSHEAMATIFKILMFHENQDYARQISSAIFREVDRLEGILSRFHEGSDISRINRLQPGKSIFINIETFECLKIAERLFYETYGTFDIAYASIMTENQTDTLLNMIFPLKLNDANCTVETLREGVKVDLGGIGKGFAVDIMASKLREFGIQKALISGGFSSILAMDAPEKMQGWLVAFRNPNNRKEVLAKSFLKDIAIGASGILKGGHIINPDTGSSAETKFAGWSVAPDAATADALSTAFMILESDEIEEFCQKHPETGALLLLGKQDEKGNKVLRFGRQDFFTENREG